MDYMSLIMDLTNFCGSSSKIWRTAGYILTIVKIIIPVLLLIFGTIDLGKSVVSGKAEDITNSAKSLGFRAAAGVIIFLLPSLVTMVMSWIFELSGSEVDYKNCLYCLSSPSNANKCNTEDAVDITQD